MTKNGKPGKQPKPGKGSRGTQARDPEPGLPVPGSTGSGSVYYPQVQVTYPEKHEHK